MHGVGNRKVSPHSPNLQHGSHKTRDPGTQRIMVFCLGHMTLCCVPQKRCVSQRTHLCLRGNRRVMLAAGPRWKGTTKSTFPFPPADHQPPEGDSCGRSWEPGLSSPQRGMRCLSLQAGLNSQRLSSPQPVLQPGDGLFFWINFSRKQIFKQPLNLSPSAARTVPAGESSQLPSCIPRHGTAPAGGERPRDGRQRAENAG